MIYIENKKRKLERIQAEYPNAIILDITSSSDANYAKWLSPFFPHYNIPIPFTEGLKATCVEAVWQGLKVFEGHDVDFRTFKNDIYEIGILRHEPEVMGDKKDASFSLVGEACDKF